MKSTTSKSVAALVIAAIGLAALTPSAFAAGPDAGMQGKGRDLQHHRQGPGGAGPRGGVLDLVCAPNGAERLEKALVGISYRVELTDAQKPLYDALKTAALTAQTAFADTCAATLPAAPTADAAAEPTRPDMLQRLQMGLKLDEARIAAMGDVLPQFEAFFSSLTDEQKAKLEFRGDRPHDGRGGDHQDHRGGPDGNRGPGRNG